MVNYFNAAVYNNELPLFLPNRIKEENQILTKNLKVRQQLFDLTLQATPATTIHSINSITF